MAERNPNGPGESINNTAEQSKLIDSILGADFIELTQDYMSTMRTSLAGGTISIPSSPSPNDIISYAGNLNKVIPAGFLLLHNDLTKEDSTTGSTRDSNPSVSSLVGPMLIAAGAGMVATGIVKGLFGGFSSKTTDKMQTIIEDLNDSLSADTLAKDPDVLAAQKKGFITYLKTYYIQQAAALAVSGTLESIGEGFGKAITGIFTGLINKLTGTTTNKLEIIIQQLLGTIDVKEYAEDREVQEALKSGTIAYLKTYMGVQIENLSVSTVVGSLGDSIGSFIGGIFRGIFDKVTGSTTSKIQLVIDALLGTIESHSEEYVQDEEVGAALKEGVIGYLKTYMDVQVVSMSRKETTSSLVENAVGAVTSFFSSLFGKDRDNPSPTRVDSIKNIGDTLLSKLTAAEVLTWPEIVTAQHNAVRNYVASYLQLQSDAAIRATQEEGKTKEGFLESAKNTIVTWWSGRQGKENKTVKAFLDLASSLDDKVSASSLMSNSQIERAQTEGAQKFISSYYDNLIEAALASLKITTSSNSIKLDLDSSVTLKQEQSDEKIVDTLSRISELLEELNTFIQENKSQGGDVNIVNLSPREDNLSVSIPG